MFELCMCIIFVVAFLFLFLLGIVWFICSDTAEHIHEYFAQRNRVKHPYKRLYKKMIKGREDVDYLVDWYLCDIYNYDSYENVIADITPSLVVQNEKDEIFKTFRYLLNLAQMSVLSDKQIEKILYFVFGRLILSETQAKGLEPRWYEKENLCYKNLVLLEAKDSVQPGETNEKEHILVFKHTITEQEFTVSFTDRYEIVNNIVKIAEEASCFLTEASVRFSKV